MTPNWRDLSLRIGLIGVALILFSVAVDLWVRGEAFRHPLNLVLSFLVFSLGLGALILALLRTISGQVSWFVLAGVIVAVLGSAYLAYATYTPLTAIRADDEMIAQFAVESLARGQNPYTWDYADMLRVFRDQGINYTPSLDGSYQSRLAYPALPTLLYWVVDGLGVDLGQGEVRAVGLIATITLLILLFVGAREPLRPVILLPLFIFRDFVVWSLNGVHGIIWSLPLVGMVYAWKRPVWRALLYGLACSFGQVTWLLTPFLLIYLWHHEEGTPREHLKGILQFVAVSAGVFIAANLPFLLWDPGEWISGVWEPLYAAFNYQSHGLAVLTDFGILALPREFYIVAQASAFSVMLLLCWFYAPAIGQAFWILPAMLAWFHYRSLPSYWAYWIPVLLAGVAAATGRAVDVGTRRPQPARQLRHTIPVMLVGAILIANVAWGIALLSQEPLVRVSYSPPIETVHTGIANRLHVTVHNGSNRILTPRFSIRPDYGVQTLPWRILSGPEQLGPGESGEYLIDAKTMPSRGFKVARGGQLAVTDAGGDYGLYATLDLPAQTNYENPDLIANPDFRYWPQDGAAPAEWALIAPQGTAAGARLQPFQGRMALSIDASGAPTSDTLAVVQMQQTVAFPDRFTVWVYRTSNVMNPAENAYGIEFDDGEHRVWVLFGESEQQGTLGSDDHRYIYRRAPRDVWSRHTIDLRQLYQRLGWRQPPSSQRFARGIRYAVPQVKLSLIAGDRTGESRQWVFGLLEQEEAFALPEAVVDYALAHPDSYYMEVGDKYRRQRNYHLAEQAYTKALAYNVANSAAHFGLGEAHFWLGEYAQAREAFLSALTLGYPGVGDARKGVGWSEYNLGNYRAALQQFEMAASAFLARDDPENSLSFADTYNGMGWAWFQLGDCHQAMPYFEQALVLAPNLAGAREGISLCGPPDS